MTVQRPQSDHHVDSIKNHSWDRSYFDKYKTFKEIRALTRCILFSDEEYLLTYSTYLQSDFLFADGMLFMKLDNFAKGSYNTIGAKQWVGRFENIV